MDNHLIQSSGDGTVRYQHAINLWRCAEWESIAKIIVPAEGDESSRSILALLLAAAQVQVGDLGQYKVLIGQAMDLGCDRGTLARVLLSGVLTSLGRSASVSKKDKLASYYFHKAAEVALPDNEIPLFSKLRIENEYHRIAKDIALKSVSAKLKLMKKTVCFVHIPKTAGKSINNTLLGEEKTWDELAYHKTIREHEYKNNRYKFCAIRNPFSYYVSLYSFFREYKDEINNPLKNISTDLSFSEFLHVVMDRRELAKYAKCRNIDLLPWDKRYVVSGNDAVGLFTNYYLDFCFDDPRAIRLDPKYVLRNHDKLFSLNAVIKQENLEDEFIKLMESWKLPSLGLEKLNASTHEPWQHYYDDDKLKRIVIEKDWLLFKLYYPEYLSN